MPWPKTKTKSRRKITRSKTKALRQHQTLKAIAGLRPVLHKEPKMSLARMKELVNQLNEAAKAYYQEDREIMSNFDYDRLYEELEALEASSGLQLAGSPTAKVGYSAVDGLEKVSHEVPLLSLDKTKEGEKLKVFLGEHTGVLSWKLDGLTIVLSYENGQLTRAVTRGNGTVGEDITHNARAFGNIPLRIPYTERLLIRGEAVISYSDFEAINVDQQYKNPRNLCSGTVRQLDSNVVASRPVRYYAFALLSDAQPVTRSNQLNFLADLGFDVVEHQLVSVSSLEEKLAEFRQKISDFNLPTDGLVLSYDDIAYSASLGSTSKFPRDSLAFKWADELAETTLRYIEWNTSRTGLINPIAVFDPVEIEGTTVNKASLHNVSIVRQLELGEGDHITVYKANMIIPQVAENFTRSNTAVLPEKCPVCGSSTEIIKQKEGEALYCLNSSCQAQLIGSLVHFCSRDAMNIEGLSEQTLEKWVNKGFIEDFVDIFHLEKHEQEIKQMEGFGEKSFRKLMDSIERAKDVPLANFIYALGIKHVGLSNAKLLCASTENIMDASADDLLAVRGFGEAIVHSLLAYFSDENNRARVKKAQNLLRIKYPEINNSDRPLEGQTFVITGSVERFPNRKALQNFIEEHGGKCTGSVSANTSYLINNDAASSSAKNKKAQSLGVSILTEEDFLNMLENIPRPL